MATLIICPSCQTRYEIAAVIPPEGRKVRCSKCGHIWQAMAAPEAASPGPGEAPVAVPRSTPGAPSRQGSWLQAPRGEPAPSAPPFAPSGAPYGAGMPRQPNGYASGGTQDASFEGAEDYAEDPNGDAASRQEWAQDYSYSSEADYAAQSDERPSMISLAGRLARVPPPVAIGWGALALFLVLLFAFVALAPRTVVSVLPGAAGFYAAMGTPVNALDFQDVEFSWDVTNPEAPVMTIEGQVVNQTSEEISPPPVVIELRGPEGQQVSAFTTEVAPIAGGSTAPFTVAIPAPPQPVASLEVRFGKTS